MSDTGHNVRDAIKLNFVNGEDIKHAATRLAYEARQNMVWTRPVKDITDDFTTCTSLLETGQLVKDEYFTLFESVGALEIMDPKMDTGYTAPGEATDDEAIPVTSLLPAEILWIMDELICLEISWLEDYPLSQTIFTSLHIDRILDPDNSHPYPFELRNHEQAEPNIANRVLQPYCLAMLRCTSMVLELARSQGFYEEEDFVSHTFGRDLLPDMTNEDATDRLDHAADWLQQNVTNAEIVAAITSRLLFRKLYIQSIFGQVSGWQAMIELLRGDIESSQHLAIPRPDCFSTKVLRHLATSTPPRPPLVTSWANAKPRWKKLCDDVSEAPQLTSHHIRQNPTSLQRALWAFAARRSSTLARAIIQDILFVDGKIADDLSHFELLLTDIRQMVLPGHHLTEPESFEIEAIHDPRHKGSRIIESFCDGMLQQYLNMYRALCQNRARIRRQFTQSIKELDALEREVASECDDELEKLLLQERLDTSLGQQQALRPLSNWTRYYKLKVMAETVQLGFETDIYLPDELSHMYWYLSTLLMQRRQLVEHLEAFSRRRAASSQQGGLTRQFSECMMSLRWYAALLVELDVQYQLSIALQHMYATLKHMHLISAPARDFAQPQLSHEARVKIYLHITNPPAPSMADFEKANTLKSTVLDSIAEIETSVKHARASLARLKLLPADDVWCIGTEDCWKAEIKQLETTAVAIMVAATQLRRADNMDKSDTNPASQLQVSVPAPNKRYHDWWVVPQIKLK